MPLKVNHLTGFNVKRAAAGGGVTGPADVTFSSSATDASTASTFTFSSISWPNPEAGRIIVVGIGYEENNARSISSATIGGVTADILVESAQGDNAWAAMIAAELATGTSGDVVVNISGGPIDGMGIGVWELTGAASTTPHDTDSGASDPSTGRTLTLDIPANGCAVAVEIAAVSGLRMTWSGGTGVTEQYDEDIGGISCHSGADVGTSASARNAFTFTSSYSSSVQGGAGCAASFASA